MEWSSACRSREIKISPGQPLTCILLPRIKAFLPQEEINTICHFVKGPDWTCNQIPASVMVWRVPVWIPLAKESQCNWLDTTLYTCHILLRTHEPEILRLKGFSCTDHITKTKGPSMPVTCLACWIWYSTWIYQGALLLLTLTIMFSTPFSLLVMPGTSS